MAKEEKNLLLRDLCARLPYEVILLSPNGKVIYQTDGNTAAELLVEEGWKPYLRPMDSMTEEEREEYQKFIFPCPNYDGKVTIGIYHRDLYKVQDWLNAHHFDYRGLIERELAIAVTEENNPYKE